MKTAAARALAIAGLIWLMPVLGACDDPFTQVLSTVDLKPRDVAFDRMDVKLYGGDAHVLPFFEVLYQDPMKVPMHADYLLSQAQDEQPTLASLMRTLSHKAGAPVRRGVITKPIDGYRDRIAGDDAMEIALRHLLDKTGQSYGEEYMARMVGQARAIPPQIASQAALLVYTAAEAMEWRRRALRDVDGSLAADLGRRLQLNLSDATALFDPSLYALADRFDYGYLFSGAEDLAVALDTVVGEAAGVDLPAGLSVQIDTPVGRIEISGGQDNTYDDPGGYLLVIDGGGNDTYTTAGSASPQTIPVSLVIDLGGDDRYLSPDSARPCFGGAILGYAFVVDAGGDDSYRGAFLAEGAGAFGVGCLMDMEGNDIYDALGPAQGAGYFGIGCLADLKGDDFYHAFTQSQGLGFTRGAGLLLDRYGNDRYIAEDKEIRFPSSQTELHNTSLSQGCGFGLRADFLDGHSMAGGVGLLIDGAGDDAYSCGVFGQGVGYWYGLGMLLDGGGNDSYDGAWYCQAAAAHFAAGVLLDRGGDDRYRATMNMAQGAGHDFSLGFLLDMDGDDTHEAPSLSLGAGNANGMGIYFDWRGDDVYTVEADATLGHANPAPEGSLRTSYPCYGIFMDCGGKDAYPKKAGRDNGSWKQKKTDGKKARRTEIGIGTDGEFHRYPWP